jgi:ubiquinone/menaquinone biosynthesis C-methylase UbiE
MTTLWIVLAVVLLWLTANLVWRASSRHYSLPCPTLFAPALESPLLDRLLRTETTLDRIGLRPGQRVLELGPGSGRLLIPAAQRVWPGGEAVGVDIQPGMIERLNQRAIAAGVENVTAIVSDATQLVVDAGTFDVAFLCTTLGEIPDRKAALSRCFEALKPGGRFSDTEIFPDPHYQSRKTVLRLVTNAGFELQKVAGNSLFFTATFTKPALEADSHKE